MKHKIEFVPISIPGHLSIQKLIKEYDGNKLVKQTVIHVLVDEQGRNHCETGPAMSYDGNNYYFIHGKYSEDL